MTIYVPAMPILPMPDPVADRERDEARQNPDQETLELAAQGAAKVWLAKIAIKTLRRDQREAIVAAT